MKAASTLYSTYTYVLYVYVYIYVYKSSSLLVVLLLRVSEVFTDLGIPINMEFKRTGIEKDSGKIILVTTPSRAGQQHNRKRPQEALRKPYGSHKWD